MASFSCDAMLLLAIERTPWLHPWCVGEIFSILFWFEEGGCVRWGMRKWFFETSNLASKPGFKIMAETLGINKIVVSWQHWLHLIGWKLLKVIFRLVTGMAIFNGFENCLLTLQPAHDSTANVRPMCTLPISIFVQVCHYRGVSCLTIHKLLVPRVYNKNRGYDTYPNDRNGQKRCLVPWCISTTIRLQALAIAVPS